MNPSFTPVSEYRGNWSALDESRWPWKLDTLEYQGMLPCTPVHAKCVLSISGSQPARERAVRDARVALAPDENPQMPCRLASALSRGSQLTTCHFCSGNPSAEMRSTVECIHTWSVLYVRQSAEQGLRRRRIASPSEQHGERRVV